MDDGSYETTIILYPDSTFSTWQEYVFPGENYHSYEKLLDLYDDKMKSRPWEFHRNELFWRGGNVYHTRKNDGSNAQDIDGVDIQLTQLENKEGRTTILDHCN